MTEKISGLALLREPFPDEQIGKLFKHTKAQKDQLANNPTYGINCKLCGSYHHEKAIHLDYVGHAVITNRLLDADPNWTWDFLALGENGLPVLDESGGMWIKLTVCGATRYGYGDSGEKKGGDAMKEKIGDAIRNAAMRFGAALDLWSKGTLYERGDKGTEEESEHRREEKPVPPKHGELPAITDRKIDANETGWRKLVDSGAKSVNDLIAWLSSKYTLTDAQVERIESWGKK